LGASGYRPGIRPKVQAKADLQRFEICASSNARQRFRPALRRRERDLNDDDPCRLVAAFIRRNFSFSAPCPFYSAIGKRRHNITDQSSVRPSAALATPSLQSSTPFALANLRKTIHCQRRRATNSP